MPLPGGESDGRDEAVLRRVPTDESAAGAINEQATRGAVAPATRTAAWVTFGIVGDVEDHAGEFGAHVRKYVQGFLRTAACEDWTRIEVVEVDLSRPSDSYPDQPRTAADHFEERWSQILADVDRDWINISGCGVKDGVLVLAVEWFSGRENGQSTRRPDQVSVNFSGHIGVYGWPWAGRPDPVC